MVAVLAVIGGVSATVSTINTIKNWVESIEAFVREFKIAGERLRDLQNSIQVCESRLSCWQEYWEVGGGVSSRYMRELWGSRGTENVVAQLTTIEGLCEQFHKALISFFGDPSLARQVHEVLRSENLESTSVRLEAFREYAAAIKLKSTNKQIFDFVRNLKPRTTEWLSALRGQISELESDSQKAYNTKHRKDASKVLTQEQLDIINTAVLMEIAMETRSSSEELFQLFSFEESMTLERTRNAAVAHGFMKLKIDLMAAARDLELQGANNLQDISVQYHLLMDREKIRGVGAGEDEVCILRSGPPAPGTVQYNSILDAYQAVLTDQHEAFACCSDGSWICLRRPFDDERLTQHGQRNRPGKPLVELLGDLSQDNFSLYDRIHLAYKVVECGLLLSGTSWLAKLKSNHVIRSRTRAGFYYTLDIHRPSPQSRISRESLSSTIFAIGVFLVEIGTGMFIQDVQSDIQGMKLLLGPRRPNLSSAAPGQATHKSVSTEELKALLVLNGMGDSYASAAAHCFGPIRRKCRQLIDSQGDAILTAYRNVLIDYFVNIYSPIKGLEDIANATDVNRFRNMYFSD